VFAALPQSSRASPPTSSVFIYIFLCLRLLITTVLTGRPVFASLPRCECRLQLSHPQGSSSAPPRFGWVAQLGSSIRSAYAWDSKPQADQMHRLTSERSHSRGLRVSAFPPGSPQQCNCGFLFFRPSERRKQCSAGELFDEDLFDEDMDLWPGCSSDVVTLFKLCRCCEPSWEADLSRSQMGHHTCNLFAKPDIAGGDFVSDGIFCVNRLRSHRIMVTVPGPYRRPTMSTCQPR